MVILFYFIHEIDCFRFSFLIFKHDIAFLFYKSSIPSHPKFCPQFFLFLNHLCVTRVCQSQLCYLRHWISDYVFCILYESLAFDRVILIHLSHFASSKSFWFMWVILIWLKSIVFLGLWLSHNQFIRDTCLCLRFLHFCLSQKSTQLNKCQRGPFWLLFISLFRFYFIFMLIFTN